MAKVSKRASEKRTAPMLPERNTESAPAAEINSNVADLARPPDVKQPGSMEDKHPESRPQIEPAQDETVSTSPRSTDESDGISALKERRLPMAVEKMLEQMESDAKEHLWWARIGSGAMIVIAVVVVTVGFYWFWS